MGNNAFAHTASKQSAAVGRRRLATEAAWALPPVIATAAAPSAATSIPTGWSAVQRSGQCPRIEQGEDGWAEVAFMFTLPAG